MTQKTSSRGLICFRKKSVPFLQQPFANTNWSLDIVYVGLERSWFRLTTDFFSFSQANHQKSNFVWKACFKKRKAKKALMFFRGTITCKQFGIFFLLQGYSELPDVITFNHFYLVLLFDKILCDFDGYHFTWYKDVSRRLSMLAHFALFFNAQTKCFVLRPFGKSQDFDVIFIAIKENNFLVYSIWQKLIHPSTLSHLVEDNKESGMVM